MKTFLFTLVLAFTLGLTMFSCGSGGGNGNEGESEAEAEAEGEEAEAESESESECEPESCDDGVDCTDDTLDEKVCACAFQPLHGRCDLGMICDPAEGGCVSPPPCAVASDCPDRDGACLQESCNTATATCAYLPLDSDEDGHSPQICTSVGGDDCYDDASEIYPGAPEFCDGLDNDCDGEVDSFSRSCGSDTGECVAGEQTCADGEWSQFDDVGPATEVCDGLDNDCDGEVDEFLINDCNECGPLPEEVCDGEDNDCDGTTDEGLLNACGQCGPLPEEVCDGEDNDCDGEVDNGLPEIACDGEDGDECEEGFWQCEDGVSFCDDQTGNTIEWCNNSVDNDCDGEVDEGCGDACIMPPSACPYGGWCVPEPGCPYCVWTCATVSDCPGGAACYTCDYFGDGLYLCNPKWDPEASCPAGEIGYPLGASSECDGGFDLSFSSAPLCTIECTP